MAAFESSCQIGFCGFWETTPFEFAIHLEAFNKRRKMDHQLQSWYAWHVAALSRCSKMPSLADFVGISKEDKKAENERRLEAVLMARVKKGDG